MFEIHPYRLFTGDTINVKGYMYHISDIPPTVKLLVDRIPGHVITQLHQYLQTYLITQERKKVEEALETYARCILYDLDPKLKYKSFKVEHKLKNENLTPPSKGVQAVVIPTQGDQLYVFRNATTKTIKRMMLPQTCVLMIDDSNNQWARFVMVRPENEAWHSKEYPHVDTLNLVIHFEN
jgi:hypothetical protein